MNDSLKMSTEIKVEGEDKDDLLLPTTSKSKKAIPQDISEEHARVERGEPRKIVALDGLRGIAILVVLGGHIVLQTMNQIGSVWLFNLWSHFWAGVDLFFCISGFLITGILLEQKKTTMAQRKRSQETHWKQNYFMVFYARRFLRIFPIYYMTLIFVILLGYSIRSFNTPMFQHVMSYMPWAFTYTLNIGAWYAGHDGTGLPATETEWLSLAHFWSLAVEEQFYCIWPFIVYFLPLSWVLYISIALGILPTLFRFCCIKLTYLGLFGAITLTPGRFEGLAFGSIIAIKKFYDKENHGPGIAEWNNYAKILLAVNGVIILVTWIVYKSLFIIMSFGHVILGPIVANLFFASWMLLAIQAEKGTIWYKMWTFWPLERIGVYSYGLYVYHYVLAPFFLARPDLWPHNASSLLLRFILYLIYCVVTTYCSYHFIETPMLDLKKYFTYGKQESNQKEMQTFST